MPIVGQLTGFGAQSPTQVNAGDSLIQIIQAPNAPESLARVRSITLNAIKVVGTQPSAAYGYLYAVIGSASGTAPIISGYPTAKQLADAAYRLAFAAAVGVGAPNMGQQFTFSEHEIEAKQGEQIVVVASGLIDVTAAPAQLLANVWLSVLGDYSQAIQAARLR